MQILQLIGDVRNGQGYSPSVIYNARWFSPAAEREILRTLKIASQMLIPNFALF